MSTINERIKEIRKNLGLKQKDFAAPLGLTPQAVGNFERREREISNQAIKSICREFNVNEDWLRTGEGKMFDERPKKAALEQLETEYSLTPSEKSFIEKYLSLPSETRIAMAKW